MAGRFTCDRCGGRVDVPAGHDRPKLRCPHCGYYVPVPASARDHPGAQAPAPPADGPPAGRGREPPGGPAGGPPKPPVRAKPALDPRDRRPRFDADGPAGPPLLAGTQADDDGPYPVPGSGVRACPHCRGELPLDAARCVHCGADLATGRRAERRYQPIAEGFVEGWSLETRLLVFAGLQVADLLFLAVAAAANDTSVLDCGGLCGHVFHSALQAFIVGSFDRLDVRRTADGKATLTRTRRVAFAPLPAEKLRWQGSAGVGVVGSHDPGLFAWAVCVYLLLLGVVPGVVFYLVYIHPEKFEVVTRDEYGGTDELLFRAADYDHAVHAAGRVAEATGLALSAR